GDPLLNFEIVKYITEYAELCNLFKKKDLEFVICTNLTLITEKHLEFFKKHNVQISTSIDGPRNLHVKNRPLLDTSINSYDVLIDKIKLCRKYLGENSVAALMTTSKFSLNRFKEIIDEYVTSGVKTIFLRSLNPYGFAKRNESSVGYKMDMFVENYIEALNYIIDINIKGTYFIEYFASLLLTRMLTPFSTGFVDMQSPAGVAISGVIYNYNGNVYVSDEARMLAAMGNDKFLMGNVHENSYQELFNSEFLHSLIKSSCLECLPECASCVYQSFCGADPVRNYSEQGDIIGNRPSSELCKRNKKIMHYVLSLIKKKDDNLDKVFWSWITKNPRINDKVYRELP
ncbi:MAG TPA: His-Xaa-Ser system radical SAM maturase HxsB, partial [Coxiellaceae bacterium]|nr:His-Xaa-Ser system radical SAM maturase HxsB [Coxiellaceae bacterium]